MQPKSNTYKIIPLLGLILFALGVISGTFLAGTAVWADQETLSFNFGIQPDQSLTTLDCPVWLFQDEVGLIKLSYTNPSDRKVDPLVRVSISEGRIDNMRVVNERQVIEPGETAFYQWEITPTDAVYKRFVMVRVYAFRSGNLPSRGTTCGIFLLPVSGTNSRPWVYGILVASLGMIGTGYILYWRSMPALESRRNFILQAMSLFGIIVVLAMITALIGLWVVGGVLLIIEFLALITMLVYAFIR